MCERRATQRCLLVLLVLVVQCGAVDIRGPHHPRSNVVAHTHHRPERDTKVTSDTKLLRDTRHIQEDLLAQGPTYVDLMNMTPEELEFHYFKLHDYDNNTKLDGLEILHAISHAVLEHPGVEREPHEDFDFFVELIDRVLAEDDSNGDGYLSYAEYVLARTKDEARRKQEKVFTVQPQTGDVPAAG
ncbi:multiple coagulation factor deficiency protein 2 homolog [Schistocerca americana]|uniref:multiple coagulation factor deficiency protein 2 homolog n=1 Tax=Schistocerca americana TaxID=7009 RepID=UPI001F4F61D6|nr:multiple coagulation factor deficiency protein 2 homolog [Schistocerca americana]